MCRIRTSYFPAQSARPNAPASRLLRAGHRHREHAFTYPSLAFPITRHSARHSTRHSTRIDEHGLVLPPRYLLLRAGRNVRLDARLHLEVSCPWYSKDCFDSRGGTQHA
jgi:hypothetical protein